MGLANRFNLIELKSDTGKDYYVEGFISTTDPDLYNDIVTEEAQKKILRQLLNYDITMDEDHDVWRDTKTGEYHDRPQNKIPAAIVKTAELRDLGDGEVGTFVRVQLNKDYPLFEKLLNSIKNGFVHSFSIAYNVIKDTPKKMGDELYRIIDDLNVFNIGMTGTPVNQKASFKLALKSFSKKMVEENKIEEISNELVDLKSKVESTELSDKVEAISKEFAEFKSQVEESIKKDEETSEAKAELKSKADAELKSFNEKFDKQEKEIAELKSVLEKVRATPANAASAKMPIETKSVSAESISFGNLLPNGANY